MAPRRSEWSCPLCTLLNSWRDRRCVACDHEREEDASSAAIDSRDVSQAQQWQAELERDYATVAAATVSTALEPTHRPANWQPAGVFFSAPVSTSANATAWRQEPRLLVNRSAARGRSSEFIPPHCVFPGHGAQQQESYCDQERPQLPEPSTSGTQETPAYSEHYPSPDYGMEPSRTQELEDAETQMPEAPSFSLLGPFPSAEAVSSSLSSWNIMDQINTSNTTELAVEHDATQSKLAQAGLDLSDSDEDTTQRQPKRRNLRRLSDATYDQSEDKSSAMGDQTWECHVCTEFNSAHLDRCELCGTLREMDNDQQTDPREQFIDLVDSDNDAPARYEQIDDDESENPYAPVRPASLMYDDEYGDPPADTTTGYDSVEDISDNEPQMLEYRPPTSSRPDLRQFEHFLSVEDMKSDYGSKIDYQNMFGEVKRGKSYDDRLLKRRRDSQKRKRQAENAGRLESAKGKKRAAASSSTKGKKKAKPGFRRASTTKAATATANRQKASGTGSTRRSSAPNYSSGINHYNNSSADFGDELTTMAWEGVGSAGYF